MVERCDELGLALEPGDAFRVGGNVGRQHLHCDLALEHRVSRAIDDTHAALAQATGDFIRADAGTGSQRIGQDAWIITNRWSP